MLSGASMALGQLGTSRSLLLSQDFYWPSGYCGLALAGCLPLLRILLNRHGIKIRESGGRLMTDQLISPHDISENYHQVEFTADLCLKCNICTSACPVAPVTELFPGPKTVGPQAQRFRDPHESGESPDASVDYCSGCGVCTLVCPHGVKIMEMNARA